MRLLRRLLMLLLWLALPARAKAQGDIDPLQGIRTVVASIYLDQHSAEVISESRLQTIVELKLRTAGLRVRADSESVSTVSRRPGAKVAATLLVMPIKTGGNVVGYSASATVIVTEPGRSHNGAQTRVILWGPQLGHTQASAENIDAAARDLIGNLLDELSNAWLRANPK